MNGYRRGRIVRFITFHMKSCMRFTGDSRSLILFSRELIQHYYILWTQLLHAIRMKSAEEKYQWLLERFPDYIFRIPAKYLASWLSVSETHFSDVIPQVDDDLIGMSIWRAGVTKKPHMHLVWHTFATTVALSNGVPIETVSKMLGHANIKQTQHYAKVVL